MNQLSNEESGGESVVQFHLHFRSVRLLTLFMKTSQKLKMLRGKPNLRLVSFAYLLRSISPTYIVEQIPDDKR